MNKPGQMTQIRRRKLAALIVDSRLASRRSAEDCAAALNMQVEEYRAFETGGSSPSLPQLEVLALYLGVPLQHFWGSQSLQQPGTSEPIQQLERTLGLRNRLVGANLRLARTTANRSLEALSELTGIPAGVIEAYETGGQSIPLPELEMLASALNLPMEHFVDKKGPVGKQMAQQAAFQAFNSLSLDQREFISRPVNQPYIQLAIRLSQMDAQKLRAIAESLLEITY